VNGRGYSLLELVFATSLSATAAAAAVPQILTTVDEYRAAGAARYLAARMQRTRMEAIVRASEVAMQIVQDASGYTFAVYVDGNGNGVRSRDIQRGVDAKLGATERLQDQFRGVDFGALPGLPAVDPGGIPPGADPIRLGSGNLASFSGAGTSSSGSLYIRGGRDIQYVVRIFGETGKVRVLKFDSRAQQWRPQ
jgi:type II secretory pathway pseudopilin PulG